MATRFEFVLLGEDAARLRAAGEEALDEIEAIESRLTLYKPHSEIAQLNARASQEPVRVSPEVFTLLARAGVFYELTGGTFDPTIAPLVKCWGFMKGSGSRPADEDILAARALVDMSQVELDPADFSVRFHRPGLMLDLGSIGKGYALDRAAGILRDAGIENALLHGGTSTIVALGADPEAGPWKVAIEDPHAEEGKRILSVVSLRDESLSVSAIWGKYFEIDGRIYGHVLDPRTGWPARDVLLGAVILPTAAETDALSTAVLLGSEADLKQLEERVPGLRYLQARLGGEGRRQFSTRGIALELQGAENAAR